MLYLENVSRGSKTEVPRNKGGRGGGGEPGIQLFSVIDALLMGGLTIAVRSYSLHALLIDIRLDEFPRGGEKFAPPQCAPALSFLQYCFLHSPCVTVSTPAPLTPT